MASSQNEANGITECIHTCADLRAQAAARTPDRLIFAPPFAPAACWCARTMVEINDQVFEVRIFDQRIEKILPNAFLGPSAETLKHAIPVAELFRQIPPRCPGASDPEHRVDEQAIILAVPSFVSFLTWNKLLNAPPLRGRKFSPRSRSSSSVAILNHIGNQEEIPYMSTGPRA